MKRLYRSRLTSVNPNEVGFTDVKIVGFACLHLLAFISENVLGVMMSLLSPPKIPLFRITLFYGPEAIEGISDTIHCVFNVKKRSWKGGVQVDIVVENQQIQQLQAGLVFQPWIEEHLREVPFDQHEDFLKKGYDLFIQFICFHKLEAYIQQGIKQENTQVPGDVLMTQTDEVVYREAENIKQQILVELDLGAVD